jgi:succinate-semialdehyde dehydrogenase/glutarate-semialdehyde dehydrogenase
MFDAYPSEGLRPDPTEGGIIRVFRPTDGSLVGELAVTPAGEIPARVARARAVQEGWGSLDRMDRIRRLRPLLDAIGSRSREIEDTIVAETGKPRTEALVEIATVLDLIRFYLRQAPSFLGQQRISTGWLLWKRAFLVRDPVGVVGVIAPWNYTFILTMTPVVTALFGGNAVLVKPSEFTPYAGLLAEDLAADAGLPEGLVQVIVGTGATGAALVESGVDKIVFTGGTETGRKVLAAASASLTPAVLELGGKDAAIVLEDAELRRAARGILWGGCQNAGQTCVSVERVFVLEEVYEAFLRELLAETRKLRAGSVPGLDMGPIVVPDQLVLLEAQLQEAIEGGGKIRAGGQRADPASNVFHPTVLTDSPWNSAVLNEETFGPILPVVAVRDQEEAIRRTNQSGYGLSASVWTGDWRRGMAVARRLRVGGVTVNDALVHYGIPALPFGGVGESGFGRTRGLEGLSEMTRTRATVVDRLGLEREPWWFPYSKRTERMLRAMVLFRWKGGVRGFAAGVLALLRGGRG